MVHGGYYYQVEKRRIYPGELPKVLHWFKWEATITWATGFLLLIVLYYLRGASLLIDPSVKHLTQGQAIALSLGVIIGSWILYDLIWDKLVNKALCVVLSLSFISGLIYFLTNVFSGRGAFILTGAVFGTMMLLNVWVRILPGQAKMLREAQAGQVPDYSPSIKAKVRSVHNTYFIFPVLFIMLSNHYPTIYNHPLNWLLLILLGTAGAMTRHAMVTKSVVERWILFPAAVALAALIYVSSLTPQSTGSFSGSIEFSQVEKVLEARCLQCHSTKPTDDVFTVAPNGVIFETEAQFRKHASHIFLHVVQAKTMPLGNKTGMTDEERALIAQWVTEQNLTEANEHHH